MSKISQKMPRAVQEYFESIETQDLERWDGTLSEDGLFYGAVGLPPLNARTRRYFFSGLVSSLGKIRFTFKDIYAAGDNVAVEWVADEIVNTGEAVATSGVNLFELEKNDRAISSVQTYWEASSVLSQLDAEDTRIIVPSPRLNVERVIETVADHLMINRFDFGHYTQDGVPSTSNPNGGSAPCTSNPNSGSAPCTSNPNSGSAPCTSNPNSGSAPCTSNPGNLTHWGDGIYPYGDPLAWDWIYYFREVKNLISRYFASVRVLDQESWALHFSEDADVHDCFLDKYFSGKTQISDLFVSMQEQLQETRILENKIYLGPTGAAVTWSAQGTQDLLRGINAFEVGSDAKIKQMYSWYM